jgi:hypothetical protein
MGEQERQGELAVRRTAQTEGDEGEYTSKKGEARGREGGGDGGTMGEGGRKGGKERCGR